jgi:hypothetical protein
LYYAMQNSMALEHHNHQPDIYIDCKVPYTRKVRVYDFVSA